MNNKIGIYFLLIDSDHPGSKPIIDKKGYECRSSQRMYQTK